jgi:hypothetical protein
MEKDAARREQVAVASAMRKLVTHFTGVEPQFDRNADPDLGD